MLWAGPLSVATHSPVSCRHTLAVLSLLALASRVGMVGWNVTDHTASSCPHSLLTGSSNPVAGATANSRTVASVDAHASRVAMLGWKTTLSNSPQESPPPEARVWMVTDASWPAPALVGASWRAPVKTVEGKATSR